MIRKIIKIRRNPSKFKDNQFVEDLRDSINTALEFGNVEFLVDLIIFYRQGFKCEDCDEDYLNCGCEECDECKQNRCICEFLGDDSKSKDRIRIRKIVWEFVRYINSLHPNFGYKYLIPDYSQLENLMLQKIIVRNEINFLENLKSSSKFPKYTSLMKRLFEID